MFLKVDVTKYWKYKERCSAAAQRLRGNPLLTNTVRTPSASITRGNTDNFSGEETSNDLTPKLDKQEQKQEREKAFDLLEA